MIPDCQQPPQRAKRLLHHLTDYHERFGILEDMEVAFHEKGRESGYRRASAWYWKQCLSAFVRYSFYLLSWRIVMLKNYLKSAWRCMRRQKVFSVVNVLGFSLALACCVLIYLFIADELSYDRFHEKADSIYGVVCRNEFHDDSGLHTTMGLGPVLEREFPEVKSAVRMNRHHQAAVRYEDKIFNERPLFTDPSFFRVFSFPLTAGDPETVLLADNSVVLTKSAASKYFGQKKILGEVLSLTLGDTRKDFFVTGICGDPPGNSSIDFEMLLNIDSLRETQGQDYMTNMRWFDIMTFVLLQEGAFPQDANRRFPPFIKEYYRDTLQRWRDSGSWKGEGDVISFHLENIKDLHLNPEIGGVGATSIQSSLILAGIGVLILFVACINFVNLSVGRASTRSIEVGMRKVLGAERKHLIHQFWVESLILTFFAMFSGLFLARMILPVFNRLAEKNLHLGSFFTAPNLMIFLMILIVVGIASGSFPGLFFSRVDPVEVLKAKIRLSHKSLFSRTLVVIQFTLTAFLLIVTFTMARQFRFINRAELGFEKEGIVVIDLQESDFERGPQSEELIERIRARLDGHPAIKDISGSIMNFDRWMVMDHIDVQGTTYDVFFNKVDFDYIKTMGLKLLEGRDFSRDFSTNASSIIVNQAFLRRFDIDQPLGLVLYQAYERDKPLTVIGVVEDFHFQSMKYRIAPLILHMLPNITVRDLLVRISLDNIPDTIKLLESVWKNVQPEKPFLFSFMDQNVENSYNRQKRWNKIVGYSTVLAVFISCMGIFALTVISIARRVREIGIRRVLGAGTGRIVGLVSREFLLLVAMANVIAWPVAYYAAKKWLQGFAYRASLAPGVFFMALLLSLLVALVTVGVLALRVALANPVQSLRTE